jgi:addiction module RelE/StbE family toxin
VRLEWTVESGLDLREIKEYIAQDDPHSAARVVRDIRRAVAVLADNPLLGRPGEIAGTRELVVGRLPYLVIYRIGQKNLRILAVVHTARLWQLGFDRA